MAVDPKPLPLRRSRRPFANPHAHLAIDLVAVGQGAAGGYGAVGAADEAGAARDRRRTHARLLSSDGYGAMPLEARRSARGA